jgi:hypothetical protein
MSLDDRLVQRIDVLLQKGNQVLATHKPNPPNIIGLPTLNHGSFAE